MNVVAASDEIPYDAAAPHLDPLGDPFLRTRFALPARPATFLRRERLVEHLDQALLTPLTMVNGAAGAGKTLLVADWAAGLRQPVAWLTLDPAIQGPGMFWAHLLQALRTQGVPVADDIDGPADGSRMRHTLTRLAARLGSGDRSVIVVLDEYDRVGAPEISRQLEFVLHHAGPGLRLVIVTRNEPLLPLHRYRAAGAMTEIRNAELAFTPEETVALLELHGLRLPVHAANALVERTGGWAAGLRLCALAARRCPDPEAYLKEFEAGHSTVADFLLAEVLDRQPPPTQCLLLRVSVLERFCVGLVNELTGRTDAQSILAGLHRENAFVEDLGHTWYRLHPLFREILRAHLRERGADLEPELHLRAARWLGRSGLLPEMLAHGAAAGEWDFTARALVDDLAIGQLFTGLRSDDLTELFSGMGPEATSPAADLVRAARELSRCDLDHAPAHLRRAEDELTADASGSAAARLSCALLKALAARLTGSPGRAEQAVRTARELEREVPAPLLEKHPELSALLLTHLGSTRLWAGRFDEARDALTTVADGTAGAATALAREEALEHLALLDHLDGWPTRAERKAVAARTQTERFGLPETSVPELGRLVLAAVAVDRHELAEAEAFLDGTDGSAPRDPVTAAARSLATARLLLARGRARAALAATEPAVTADVASPWERCHAALVASAAHLAEGRPDEAARVLEPVAGEQPVCAVGAARAHLAAGDPDTALKLLDALGAEADTGPAVLVRATLLRARAAHEAGDLAATRRLLARSLTDARRERLRLPFLEAGAWLGPHLTGEPLRGLAAGWLLPGATSEEPAPLLVEHLSGREHDVLERLAQLMSTEDIAADLYVSVNTVKTHLKSVYRKLAVNRRGDAVRRARELHLL
ncbi:tetratricopeptide repeat protein [Streptomyces ferrugineus]|uniref:Tetratricopeptide repeat protein n=1 Tax=Streptomyces ferrugineus TaxID=1413221 RepID=A0A7M2SNA0_9ACTN|nr:LuxR C-terminal-related transcriptional regulator [Streptomyces ferrugineus]QOV36711.1 tetratricopeptide repeat protein [Streptomyces ferrugineus]